MQATPWLREHHVGAPLSRELCASPVSMPSFRLTMRQQWFTPVRLLAAHLTRSRQAFCRNAHHPGS